MTATEPAASVYAMAPAMAWWRLCAQAIASLIDDGVWPRPDTMANFLNVVDGWSAVVPPTTSLEELREKLRRLHAELAA